MGQVHPGQEKHPPAAVVGDVALSLPGGGGNVGEIGGEEGEVEHQASHSTWIKASTA